MDDPTFIRMIAAQPKEDGPRLVYADWLEEHGECERAEFIRVQIELATPGLSSRRMRALRIRERELLFDWDIGVVGSRCKRWLNIIVGLRPFTGCVSRFYHGGWDYPDPYRPSGTGSIIVAFRRGFVSHVCTDLRCWFMERFDENGHARVIGVDGYGPEIVKACPVESVKFSDIYAGTFRPQKNNPNIQRIRITKRNFPAPLRFAFEGRCCDKCGPNDVCFASREDMRSAISEASIQWARGVNAKASANSA